MTNYSSGSCHKSPNWYSTPIVIVLFIELFVCISPYTSLGADDDKSSKLRGLNDSYFILKGYQQIGLDFDEVTLRLDSKGVIYQNSLMKKDTYIPWMAIVGWKIDGVHRGRPNSPAEYRKSFFLTLRVDDNKMPEGRNPQIMEKYSLCFSIDLTNETIAACNFIIRHNPDGKILLKEYINYGKMGGGGERILMVYPK